MAAPQPVEIQLGRDFVALIARVKTTLGPTQFQRAVLEFFDRRGAKLAARIIREKLSGQLLKRRTGALARSIVGEGSLIRGLPGLRVGVIRGPALRYAGVLEAGTKGRNPESPFPTIRPRKAKALAVPVGKALTAAGVPRYPSPRAYPQKLTFIRFRKQSKAIGALYATSDLKKEQARARRRDAAASLANVKALWLLLREVDITPRFFLRDIFFGDLDAMVVDLNRFIAELIIPPRSKAGELTA